MRACPEAEQEDIALSGELDRSELDVSRKSYRVYGTLGEELLKKDLTEGIMLGIFAMCYLSRNIGKASIQPPPNILSFDFSVRDLIDCGTPQKIFLLAYSCEKVSTVLEVN